MPNHDLHFTIADQFDIIPPIQTHYLSFLFNRMTQIPEELKKVHIRYHELVQEKGEEFAEGFLTYMVQVDYLKKDPHTELLNDLRLWYSEAFEDEIQDMAQGSVETDIYVGFQYGQTFGSQAHHTYTS